MCAIAGELNFIGRAADPIPVERMAAAMTSRGPDGSGEWAGNWVALAHRRLEIIDLSGRAAQPMTDESLGLVAVFNGCIYNHRELRAQLRDQYSFATTSDTEVILKSYARWGEDFVDHLIGMFAIVIYDLRRDRVIMARDRLGIKPLYLTRTSDALRFASTLPGILAGGGVDTTVDPIGLHHYLSWHSIVPAPHTILRGVSKVPPATILVVHPDGQIDERVYWSAEYTRSAAQQGWSDVDWTDAIHDALRTAVERRLVADVPVGVLLSGGLDSSMLVGLAAELSGAPIDTFSIGFESAGGQAGDEYRYSDAVAQQFGTTHHRIHVPDRDLAAAIPGAVAAMSEPMASHDVTAFYLLAQKTSQHIKVVQSGQGADEVFAGYSYHLSAAQAPRRSAFDTFTEAFQDQTHEQIAGSLTASLRCDEDVSQATLRQQLAAPGAETALDAILRLDTHLLMVDDPVKRVDNMTMAWGLEARVPFLDQDLVPLAARCPPELKSAQGGKGVLKDIARRFLPADVVDRRKGYFPVPGLRHLDGDVLQTVQDTLTSTAARNRGIFRQDFLDRLLADPNATTDQRGGNALWSIAVLEMWLQEHRA